MIYHRSWRVTCGVTAWWCACAGQRAYAATWGAWHIRSQYAGAKPPNLAVLPHQVQSCAAAPRPTSPLLWDRGDLEPGSIRILRRCSFSPWFPRRHVLPYKTVTARDVSLRVKCYFLAFRAHGLCVRTHFSGIPLGLPLSPMVVIRLRQDRIVASFPGAASTDCRDA